MTHQELQMLLADVQVAQKQLDTIARRIQRALGGPGPGDATYRSAQASAQAPGPSTDRRTPPDDALLADHPCPKCKAAMRWVWAKSNDEWFAGCTDYAAHGKKGCRGSRSYVSVVKGEPSPKDKEVAANRATGARRERKEQAHAPAATSVPGPWGQEIPHTVEDIERIEKHHGMEAAAEVFQSPHFLDMRTEESLDRMAEEADEEEAAGVPRVRES